MAYTLGIDIGTYETKGVLVDLEGQVIAQAARAHKMLVPQPGWAEHRPEEDWWGDFVFVCQTLLNESGIDAQDIKAVACSAIGPCMLPVDADGAPLMNGVLYGVDGRAEAEVRELTARIGEATIIARCGNALTSQSVGPKILWLKNQRRDIYDRTAHVLTSTSFLVQRLTGEVVIDHYTAANFSPLYDVQTQSWVDDLADDILPLDKLPRLLWSHEIAGQVTSSAAAETGLAAGTPVTAGTIDAAAEAFSVGVDQPGDMMMMYGSTIFIILRAAAQVSDPRIWYAPWLFEGEHASMAGLATSGTLTHWFRDQFARDLPTETAFADLAREAAASPPGATGVLLLPYFSGERTPIHDVDAKGAFFGLNLTHTRGDMYRALIEGIAYGTRHVTDTFADLGQTPSRLLAVGGGTRNRLWLQATSDITGIDQLVCEKTTGASYGDAFMAALAIGAVRRGDIAAWNPVAETIRATPDAAYQKNYDLFRRLYEQTKDIAAELGS
ncbi:FGGY-family carbohydrate kinase [Roseobacter sp. YSTF-M11]|uniref:FGGY-family carbohydrate kinase n=1 Tax=Roseobacter insulae TaxID=2859783 RepID=A0A9X1K2B8_9RHOB|nr:FGGY-family carbohydrate kinase [Roseobacter insulae]MBW4707397.1 FGGY-family carbohydrate kinase [Roseobacter insulae]